MILEALFCGVTDCGRIATVVVAGLGDLFNGGMLRANSSE